jgi:TonB family protein
MVDFLSNFRCFHRFVLDKKVYLGASIITLSLANNSCSEDKSKETIQDKKTIGETTTCYEIKVSDIEDDDVYINQIPSNEKKDSSNQSINSKHKNSVSDTSPKKGKSIIQVTSCYINLEVDNIQEETPALPETNSTIYTITDEDPEFIGRTDSLLRYISTNIKYFPSSCYVSVEGTVYVNFVITKTGELTDIKVIRGLSPAQDEEALRKWNPARHQGKPVNSYFTLPIRFKLQ